MNFIASASYRLPSHNEKKRREVEENLSLSTTSWSTPPARRYGHIGADGIKYSGFFLVYFLHSNLLIIKLLNILFNMLTEIKLNWTFSLLYFQSVGTTILSHTLSSVTVRASYKPHSSFCHQGPAQCLPHNRTHIFIRVA